MVAHQIHGAAPELAGKKCQGLLCQQFEADGRVVAEASILHLKFDDTWHRVNLEPGRIEWRVSTSTPVVWEVPEKGWRYPIVDVGASSGLNGMQLLRYTMAATDADARLELLFESGRRVVMEHKGDRTRLAVI